MCCEPVVFANCQQGFRQIFCLWAFQCDDLNKVMNTRANFLRVPFLSCNFSSLFASLSPLYQRQLVRNFSSVSMKLSLDRFLPSVFNSVAPTQSVKGTLPMFAFFQLKLAYSLSYSLKLDRQKVVRLQASMQIVNVYANLLCTLIIYQLLHWSRFYLDKIYCF